MRADDTFAPVEPAPAPDGRRRPFPALWQALLLLILIHVIANTVAVMMLVPTVVPDILKHGGLTRSIDMAGLGIVGNSLAFGVVIWLTVRLAGLPRREVLPFGPVPLSAWPGMILSVVGALALVNEVTNRMAEIWPPPDWVRQLFEQFLGNGEATLPNFVFLVVVAPVTEEFFFRGALLASFRRRWGGRRAIVGSAVLFGLVHLIPWQVVPAIGIGFLFAWWTARAQSLWPALLGHAVINGSSLLVSTLHPTDDPMAVLPQPLWVTASGAACLILGLWISARTLRPATADPHLSERSLS